MSKATRCDRCKHILDNDPEEPYVVKFAASKGDKVIKERSLEDCCPGCLDIMLRCIDGTRKKSKPKPTGESQKKEGKSK